MSKEVLKEGKQTIKDVEDASLYRLYLRLSEVISSRQPNDKLFIKNELKLKPITDVPKHSFKDNCSSASIIDFTLMQAAFRHFSKISDSHLAKDDLRTVSKTDDTWKEHYLLESELVVIPSCTSEESDLEKTLFELQMSEISNDISDPEVREFCSKFSVKTLSDTLCSVPEDSSQELSPTKPPIETNGHLTVKRGVKRKRINAYSRRKKPKQLKLLSKSDDLKLLPRKTKKLSSDSSEDCGEHSVISQSEQNGVEINPCTSEVSDQSNVNTLEQKRDSVNLISPINSKLTKIVKKTLKYNARKKSKPRKSVTEKNNSNYIQFGKIKILRNAEISSTSSKDLGMSDAQQIELSEGEKNSCCSEEAKHSSFNKLRQKLDVISSEAIIKTINDVVQNDPIRCISSCEASIKISDVEGNDRTVDCKAVENHNSHEMDISCAKNIDGVPGDASSKDSFLTLDECKNTSNFQAIDFAKEFQAIDFAKENQHTSDKDSPSNQDSQTESQIDLMDSLESDSKTSKEAFVKKPEIATFLSQQSFDQETVLDYEYDGEELSEVESLEGHYIRVNSERYSEVEDHGSCSADKELHRTEDYYSSSIALNSYNGKVVNEKVIEESHTKAPVNENHMDSEDPIATKSSQVAFKPNSEERLFAPGNEKIVSMPDVSKDVDMRKEFMPSFSYVVPTSQKNPAAFYSDDEDSNSDSEQSFKRRVNNNSPKYQNLKKVSEQPPSTKASNLQNGVPDHPIRTLHDCIRYIKYHCKNNFLKAVNTADEYLSISFGNTEACCTIFEVLFLDIKKAICLTNIIPEEAVNKAIDLLKKYIIPKEAEKVAFETYKIDDILLCSMIIYEYFQEPLLVRFALDLCTFCQKEKIPIKDNAVQAYTDNAVSKSAPELILLNFLDYVESVCKLNFPKPLLNELLERVPKGENLCLLPEFKKLCELLCKLDILKFEKKPLEKFVVICVKNNCWNQVASFFRHWACKGDLSDVLLSALQFRLEDVGMFFKKLAGALYHSENQEPRCKVTFGYIGISIMLKAYFKGKSEDENNRNIFWVNAFEVLYTLFKYNVNFYYLDKSFYTSEIANGFSIDPFNMVFIAIEICLSLERPKDAYLIIKGLTTNLQELPGSVKDLVHIKNVRLDHLKCFLKLTQLLHDTDPLDTGLKSFHDFLSFLAQEDNDHLAKECEDINLEVIKTLFNDYLVANMNKKLNDNVLKLYQLIEGPYKALLTLDSEVLRGVVVFLSENQRMDEAMSLFEVGCIRSIYEFKKKTSKEDFPWKVTVLSHWTSQEMRLVIEQFLKSLFPVLMNKKRNIDFNSWYSVQIVFKEFHCTPSKINCLMEQFAVSDSVQKGNCTIEYAMKRTCNILKSIDPDFNWIEREDHVLLSPSAFYSYWNKNYAKSKEKDTQPLQISATKVLSFGESRLAAASAESLEMQMDPNTTSPCTDSSPLKHHLNGEEVTSTTSDLFMRRRTSLSSSDKSSSSHLSETELATKVPQPFLFGSPISNFVGNKLVSPRNSNYLQAVSATKLSQSPHHSFSPRLSQSPHHSFSPRLSQSPHHSFSPRLPQSPHHSFSSRLSQSPHHSFSPRVSQSPHHSLNPWSPQKTPQELAPPSNIPFQSPKQVGNNNSLGRHTSISVVNPTTIMRIDENKNHQVVSGLSLSPPKNNSLNSGLVEGVNNITFGNKGCSLRNINNRTNLNTLPSLDRHMGGSSSLANHSPELSVFTEPLNSKLKGRKRAAGIHKWDRNNKKVRSTKLQSIPNGASESAGHVVEDNLNAAVDEMLSVPKNDFSTVNKSHTTVSLDEHLCASSSLANHGPQLSLLEEPPRPQLKAKRRLNMNREIEAPKMPLYRIQTPCKLAKVIRPITPCFKSVNVRCKTPVSFSSTPRLNPLVKRPIPNAVASTSFNKKYMDFTNFVVTVPGNSANHKIAKSLDNSNGKKLFPSTTVKKTLKKISGPILQNSKGISCAKKRPKENFAITKNFNQTVVQGSAENVQLSDISVTVINTSNQSCSQPIFKVPQARRCNDVPENDFQKILNFLKSKVMLKCKTTSPDEQLDKANSLANTFIENNGVQLLDAKTKKLLFQFAETCIY